MASETQTLLDQGVGDINEEGFRQSSGDTLEHPPPLERGNRGFHTSCLVKVSQVQEGSTFVESSPRKVKCLSCVGSLYIW